MAGGPIATHAIEALGQDHELVGVIRKRGRLGRLRGTVRRLAGAPDPVSELLRVQGVPEIWIPAAKGPEAAEAVRRLRPDVGCIATFPSRIGDELLDAAGGICFNMHSSLLPRHRGPNPLFWTYHANDTEGGVTVHVATPVIDAGPIVSSGTTRIERGEDAVEVHRRYAAMGARLLADAVTLGAAAKADARSQDEADATDAPRTEPGRVYSDGRAWPAERAWHFLRGVGAFHQDAFHDESGQPVRYRSVPAYEERDPVHEPGSVLREGSGWRLWCADGFVDLSP